MSEANSPTNRNLILTSTDLQLMNSIVPKPYMILWNVDENRKSPPGFGVKIYSHANHVKYF